MYKFNRYKENPQILKNINKTGIYKHFPPFIFVKFISSYMHTRNVFQNVL